RGTGAARLDAGTGKVAWSRPARAGDYAGAPVLAGGLLGTIAGDRYTTFDPRTGKPGWSADVSGYFADAHAAGDVLLFGSATGAVTALDGATGERLWQRRLSGHSDPRIGPYDAATGLVHFFEESADGRHTTVSSVRARTGELVHRRRLPGQLVPAATSGPDGTVFLTARGYEGQIDAVVRYDVARGTTNRVPLPFRMGEARIAVRGGAVFLLDREGTLVAVDTATDGGRELWQLETAAGQVSPPVLGDGGRLYFSAADGRLLAVDTVRGTLLGQTEPRLHGGKLGHAASLPAPVVLGPRVIGTAPDGSVFAVDGADPSRW
ncbi:PQQ-binding-like beta-propeller repeat protein, partial [Streptomyces sp.]|uniref:outer membrane protein assembly factor BamB family protein n=1 Tax=Streptomyces sp. TaxID=1931 RepID=UPI002F93C856